MQNRSDGVFTLPSLRRRFDKCPNPAELSARRPCRPGGGGRLLIVLVLIVLVVLRVGVVRVGHERAAVVGTSVVGRSVVGRRAHRARGRSVCAPSNVCALKGDGAHRRDASICVSIISICVPHPDIHSRFIKFPIQRGGGPRCRHGAMTVDGGPGRLSVGRFAGRRRLPGRRSANGRRPCTRENLHERMEEWARGGTDVLPLQSPANSPLQTAPIAKPQFSLRPNFPATGDALGGLGPAEIRAGGRLRWGRLRWGRLRSGRAR